MARTADKPENHTRNQRRRAVGVPADCLRRKGRISKGSAATRPRQNSQGARQATPASSEARLTVAIKSVEARHEVKVSRLREWPESMGKSPREQALKNELRKLLDMDA